MPERVEGSGMQALEKAAQKRNSGNIDITALADRRRPLPRSGLANDAFLRKTRSQQVGHPLDVALVEGVTR